MKVLLTLLCTTVLSVCSADYQPHEFQGFSETYNIRNLRLLAKFLPENPVIVEAGAYEGRDTGKLAQRFSNGRVFAFEPLKSHFPILQQNMSSLANVTVFNEALDIISGTKNFYVCHGTNGQNTIFEFHSSLLKPVGSMAVHLMGPIEPTSCISLVDFCKNQKIDQIDFLWLSTEGSELQILHGAQELIEKVSLVYVRTKLYPSRQDITLFPALKDFMEAHGFVLLSHFYLKDIHGDALFVKREKLDKLVK